MQTKTLADVRFVGCDLRRPECVLATQRGALYVSDRDNYSPCCATALSSSPI